MNVFLSRWQTARDCFAEALTLDPASKVIQSNITVCSFYMGQLKEVWSKGCGQMRAIVTACQYLGPTQKGVVKGGVVK